MFSLMHGLTLNCAWLWSVKWLVVISTIRSTTSASAVYLNMERVPVRHMNYDPYRLTAAVPFSRFNVRAPRDENIPLGDFSVLRDVLYIEPSDAVSKIKWSQPAVEHPHPGLLAQHEKEKRLSLPRDDYHAFSSSPSLIDNHDFQIPLTKTFSEESSGAHLFRSTVNSIVKHHDKIDVNPTETPVTEQPNEQPPVSKPQLHLSRNNFTDSNDSHVLVPSNSVFDYQSSVMLKDEASNQDSPSQSVDDGESTELDLISHVPHTVFPTVHGRDALESDTDLRKRLFATVSPDSFETTTSYQFSSTNGFVNRVDDVASSVPTADNTGDEFPDALPSVESTTSIRLGSGAVAGIVIAVLICVTVITSAVIYLLYRRYNGKCTNVVEGKFNSDNCGYLDDSLRSSVYLNNHIELPKENSEEMSSLDNDSFLNSLETMTIQNYWADNTKNTKV